MEVARAPDQCRTPSPVMIAVRKMSDRHFTHHPDGKGRILFTTMSRD